MNNRSSLLGRVPIDVNGRSVLAALSTADNKTVVSLQADPVTHLLQVSSSGGGGGSDVQYSEGTTTSPATGNAFLGRYSASPSGTSTDGGLYAPLMDNFHQLKVVPVGTIVSNMTQINGTTVSVGNGTTDTGTQRVTLSSDSTGQIKLATGANVIGSISNTAFTANIGTTNGLALDATLTGGTQQTKITDGTTVSSNLAGDTGQNAQLIVGNRKEISYSVTANNAAFSQDVSNYRWISIQTVTMGSGTLTFQGSNDNTNWSSVALQQPQNMSNVPAISTSSAGQLWAGPLQFRYFRGNVSGYTTGTIAGTVEFFSLPMQVLSPGGNVALTGTNGINVAQIAGTTTLVGNGVTGTGSQRVTIASDNSSIPTVETAPTTVLNGKTTVTTAGTRVTLAASTTAKSVTIKALAANTGTIYIGNSTVAASNGFQLAASDSITLDIANLNTVNIDSSVNGEGVTYAGIN